MRRTCAQITAGTVAAMLAFWLALPFTAVAQDAPKKLDSSGTIEVAAKKLSAEELARAFLADPQRAERMYIATPREVKRGEMIVPLLNPVCGEVEKADGKEVYLKTGTPKVRVRLRTRQAVPDAQARGKQASATGFVRSYRDGVITIDVHRIHLTPARQASAKER